MKEFFKPTKAKIILMLLIPFYLAIEIGAAKAGAASSISLTYNLIFFSLPYVVMIFIGISLLANVPLDSTSWFWPQFSLGQKIWIFFLELIIPLLINYVLACLIVYLYRRIKERERRKAESFQQE